MGVSAFTLFGELQADTKAFQNSLRDADTRLKETTKLLANVERGAEHVGDTTATTARKFGKLEEQVQAANVRLKATAEAFAKGNATAKQMASAVTAFERTTERANDRLRDMNARFTDLHAKSGVSLSTLSDLGNVVTGVHQGFLMLSGIVSSVTHVITGLTTASFNWINTASEFGSSIKDMQEKTGLAAETLTAMKFAGEQGGVAFEKLMPALNQFAKNMGKAAEDSDKAAAMIKKFGVDPVRALDDLDGAMAQAFKTISQMPEGIRQMTAAQELFGAKAGTQMIPLIKAMKGDMNAAIETARKFGVTLSEDDVKAADDFGDALSLLSTQGKIMSSRFALQIAPELANAMGWASNEIVRHQGDISHAITRTGDIVRGLTAVTESGVGKQIAEWGQLALTVWRVVDPMMALVHWAGKATGGVLRSIGETGAALRETQEISDNKINSTLEVFKAQMAAISGGKKTSPFATLGDDAEVATGKTAKLNKELKASAINLSSLLGAMRGSTMTQESGGNQNARNGRTGATGLFQVMPGNVPSWTKEALGKSLNLDQFKASTAAQIQVFNHFMGNYLKKALQQTAGDWQKAVRMAAAAWYGGEDNMKDYNANFGGKGNEPTFKEYTTSVLNRVKKALGGGGGEADFTSIFNEMLREQDDRVRKVTDAWTGYLAAIVPAKTEQQKLADILGEGVVQQSLAGMDETTRNYTLTLLKSQAIANDYANAIGKIIDNAERLEQLRIDSGIGVIDRTGGDPSNFGGLGGGLTDEALPDLGVPPPPLAAWENFWATMTDRFNAFRNSLPSMKQAIGENLIASIDNLGTVFGNAFAQWDGTAQGFFKSLAQGFRSMVQTIVAEMIRLLAMKAIMQIIGAFAGAAGGGGGGAGATHSGPISIGHTSIGGMASGGSVEGRGTSTSDSIMARLSRGEFVMSAKAVGRYGVNFFEQLNNNLSGGMMPAFASGGFVGGASVINNTTSNQPINVYVQGGGSREQNQQTGNQIARAITMRMERERQRNK